MYKLAQSLEGNLIKLNIGPPYDTSILLLHKETFAYVHREKLKIFMATSFFNYQKKENNKTFFKSRLKTTQYGIIK